MIARFFAVRRRKKIVAKRLAVMVFEANVAAKLRQSFPPDCEAYFLAYHAAVDAFKETQE